MTLRIQAMIFLMLSLFVLLITNQAIADCDVEPSTEDIPFTYDDHIPSDETKGVRSARLYKLRVGAVVSTSDAEKLLYAANLGYLNPDIDGNGEATLWFETTIEDVNEILLSGDCEGVIFGPRNMFWVIIYAYNDNGGLEVPMLSFMTDGEPYIDGPKEAIELDARFEVEMEQKQGLLRFKLEVESADQQFYVKNMIEIPADAGFSLSYGDLYKFNIPVWYATSPAFTKYPLWLSYHRMQYDVQPGDGSKVQIETRGGHKYKQTRKNKHKQHLNSKHDDVSTLCFNQLSKATGQDLCVRILRAEGGSVMRSEEAYQKAGGGE